MNDYSHHTPRVITEAESVEALAAEWREQRPVSFDDAMAMQFKLTDVICEVLEQERDCYGAAQMIVNLVSERDALAVRVRELEADRDRLKLSRADRECLRIGQEMQRAAGELPEGFVIEIAVELGYGGVTLIDKSYQNHEFNDTVDGLSHCITQAIDAALTTPESKP